MRGLVAELEILCAENAFGAPVYRVAETPSTMEEARALAAGGAVPGTAVMADHQTSGRGRFRDRSWSGERGADLMFTVMLAPDAREAAAFPLKVGLAACLALGRLLEASGREAAPLRLKWPNDILFEGRKVCGILCESSGPWYYAGIGVNCAARAFPPGLRSPAVSLAEACGSVPDRAALLAAILASLRSVLSDPEWLGSLNERLYGRGLPIRFLEGMPESGETIEGILSGLGSGGELLIEVEGRTRACSSGEILR